VKVGDLVRHKHGTLRGAGVILGSRCAGAASESIPNWGVERARILWTAHGQTKILDVATTYLEVINAAR
jgi:hypothetical protein